MRFDKKTYYWTDVGRDCVVSTIIPECDTCGIIRPLQLIMEDGSVLGKICCNETTNELEISGTIYRDTNFLHAFVISATFLFSRAKGHDIDAKYRTPTAVVYY